MPAAQITGIVGAMAKRLSKKKVGQVPESLRVMLTAFIAAANMVSRNNVALGIEAQGFSAACGLQPLATPAAVVASPA